MISLNDITSFDVIVVLLFLLFVLRGTWVGFMRQLAVFVALIAGYLLAGRVHGQMMPIVESVHRKSENGIFYQFWPAVYFGLHFSFSARQGAHLVMEVTLAGWFDRLLGLLLGGVKGAVCDLFSVHGDELQPDIRQ